MRQITGSVDPRYEYTNDYYLKKIKKQFKNIKGCGTKLNKLKTISGSLFSKTI